jgi:hypothetical protein
VVSSAECCSRGLQTAGFRANCEYKFYDMQGVEVTSINPVPANGVATASFACLCGIPIVRVSVPY